MRGAALCPAAAALLLTRATTAYRLPVSGEWALQSSAALSPGTTGSAVSTTGFDDNSWYALDAFPATVLAGLQQHGEYPDIFFSTNMEAVDSTRFDASWWYRTEIVLPPAGATPERTVSLVFKGINYRANIWVGGKLIASNTTVRGTFREFEVDVTDTAATAARRDSSETPAGVLAVAVEVFRPFDIGLDKELTCRGRDKSECLDLAISWVDWAPTPPDNNMGLWRGVDLVVGGPVEVRHPQVTTTLLPSGGARLGVLVALRNLASSAVRGTLSVQLDGPAGRIATCSADAVTASASNTTLHEWDVTTCPSLSVANPPLWWPWQMGSPTLVNLTVVFTPVGGTPDHNSTLHARVGLREVTKTIDGNGNALFAVNGKRILIRGGGWAPDLLQRMTPERHAQELALVRHLGLNAVRLEGKLQDDDLFDQADKLGILMLPGICCCDAWQQWPLWGDEQRGVAAASLRDQVRRLRAHPSVITFLYSSDEMPPADVERAYLGVFADERWAVPTVAAASYQTSQLTGNVTGVKMTGPYGWVPPNFWTDPRGLDNMHGGAFGFITETSPGGSPLTLESFERVVPPANRWSAGGPTADWDYHCGSSHGAFGNLGHFSPALEARLGNTSSAEAYLAKAQLQTYESHRAMFEAYSGAKYNSTGIIQWMLNNGWPEMMWHLYDYFLNAGGAYYGAKKAMEPLHVQYSPSTRAVAVVNSRYTAAPQGLTVIAETFGLDGERLYSASEPLGALGPDGVAANVLKLPPSAQRKNGTTLLRLRLVEGRASSSSPSSSPSPSSSVLSVNEYWLPPSPDEFEMGGCFTGCKVDAFANMTDLGGGGLPRVRLSVAWAPRGQGEPGRLGLDVTVSNPSPSPALFTRLRALRSDGADVLPAHWDDNYLVLLLAGEARTVGVTWADTDQPDTDVSVVATPFNNVDGSSPP